MKIIEINNSYDNFKISEALMITYKLVWDDFCSIFLEIIKPRYGDAISLKTLNDTKVFFKKILSLLEPFMPFISNELSEKLEISNIKLEWPNSDVHDQKIIENFNHINELITKVRNFKKANNIPFKESIKLYFDNKILDNELISVIKKLTNSELIILKNKEQDDLNSILIGKYIYYIESEKKLNHDDISEIKDSLEYNIGFEKILEKKLSNKSFIENAPQAVVDNEMKKLDDVKSKIKLLEKKISQLKS
tara:strand:- start:146 stop:892 length:747 start_codon:yes stop_codon:yes gene_type:complete